MPDKITEKVREWLGYPYPKLQDRDIIVRVRSGHEYRGRLFAWGPYYITLIADGEEVMINREDNNIVSIQVLGDALRRD